MTAMGKKTKWTVTGHRGQSHENETIYYHVCDTLSEVAEHLDDAKRTGFVRFSVVTHEVEEPLTSRPRGMDEVEWNLIQYLGNEGHDDFGKRANDEGWDPAETAIRAMRELAMIRQQDRDDEAVRA